MIVETDGPVGVARLNRPEKLNALSSELASALSAAIDGFERDDRIHAVVIGGAGTRAFSAGADMHEQLDRMHRSDRAGPAAIGQLLRVVQAARKPLIGAIEGYCYGAGLALALALDIRICSDTARFHNPGAEYGIVSSAAILTSIVGPARAKELVFSATVVEAREADRIGLVNRVVPLEAVWPAALELAHRIAANSPEAVRAAKSVIDTAAFDGPARDLETRLVSEAVGTDDVVRRFGSALARKLGG